MFFCKAFGFTLINLRLWTISAMIASVWCHSSGTRLHLFWDTENNGENKRLQHAYLAIFCVDVFIIPLHYRSINEQAPHDDNHFQHLSQGHLAKYMGANMNAHPWTCRPHKLGKTMRRSPLLLRDAPVDTRRKEGMVVIQCASLLRHFRWCRSQLI